MGSRGGGGLGSYGGRGKREVDLKVHGRSKHAESGIRLGMKV